MNVAHDTVHEFHDQSLKMLLAGNVDCFSMDGQWLPPKSPPIKGRDNIGEIVSQIINDPNFSVSHEIVDIDVSGSGDLAYIHYTYKLTLSGRDGNPVTEQGKAIYVLKNQPEAGWKILIDIWNSDVEDQNKAVVQRYWDGKWNKRRPETLDELLTPDVQYHSPSMQMNGIEEYKQVYGMYLSALHDTQLTIEELVAEDDKVMSRVSVECSHKGELDGIPPTGNTLTVNIFTVFRLVDGKIAEEWELADELGFMHQLGMELKPATDQSEDKLSSDHDNQSKVLMDLSRRWSTVISSGDLESGMDFWANDAVMLPPDFPTLNGKEAIRKYVEASADVPGFRISWEPLSAYVSSSGDLAYMIERNVTEVDGEDGNKDIAHGKVVTIWRKDPRGQWKNVVDMWNAAPAPHIEDGR